MDPVWSLVVYHLVHLPNLKILRQLVLLLDEQKFVCIFSVYHTDIPWRTVQPFEYCNKYFYGCYLSGSRAYSRRVICPAAGSISPAFFTFVIYGLYRVKYSMRLLNTVYRFTKNLRINLSKQELQSSAYIIYVSLEWVRFLFV